MACFFSLSLSQLKLSKRLHIFDSSITKWWPHFHDTFHIWWPLRIPLQRWMLRARASRANQWIILKWKSNNILCNERNGHKMRSKTKQMQINRISLIMLKTPLAYLFPSKIPLYLHSSGAHFLTPSPTWSVILMHLLKWLALWPNGYIRHFKCTPMKWVYANAILKNRLRSQSNLSLFIPSPTSQSLSLAWAKAPIFCRALPLFCHCLSLCLSLSSSYSYATPCSTHSIVSIEPTDSDGKSIK